MALILAIIAVCLFVIVAPINSIVVMIIKKGSRGYFRALNRYWFKHAKEIDIFGNKVYADTWNIIFIKKDGYKFGFDGETISSALGKNQLRGDLSTGGWIMVYVLWFIDVQYWFKGGHCINSIDK